MHLNTSLSRLFAGLADVPDAAAHVIVKGMTEDSRKVEPGFVFAALPGTNVDGLRYVQQAFAKGAVAAIVPNGTKLDGGLLIESKNPRRLLALAAARFSGEQPETIVAVTGTNGKTSVSVFVRQIWAAMGFRAASLGTVGVIGPDGVTKLDHTTPGPVQLAQLVADLREDHIKHLAVEASSHGLDQYRLDGLQLTAGGFTNITRDHLDYHGTFEKYFDAKMRLFSELLSPGSGAVINMDSDHGDAAAARATSHGLKVYGVGTHGTGLRLIETRLGGLEQHLRVETGTRTYDIALPLVGGFQASNALVAAGLVIAAGGEESQALHALESLVGALGRLDLVGRTAQGAAVFVDYAHTPDALDNAISALRPFAKGKIITVFGCGGDRDKGKRPLMAAAAKALSDVVVVTDDNPRSEDPAVIRRDALVGAPGALEIADRALAIRAAVDMLMAGDVLLVAGKGHEQGQTIGSAVLPFNDHDAVRAALKGVAYHG
jgi:UDP-N-acetylmuramoyl-L-alanyl-D-glutamate--2,6-diaminopimelate ligase